MNDLYYVHKIGNYWSLVIRLYKLIYSLIFLCYIHMHIICILYDIDIIVIYMF